MTENYFNNIHYRSSKLNSVTVCGIEFLYNLYPFNLYYFYQ